MSRPDHLLRRPRCLCMEVSFVLTASSQGPFRKIAPRSHQYPYDRPQSEQPPGAWLHHHLLERSLPVRNQEHHNQCDPAGCWSHSDDLALFRHLRLHSVLGWLLRLSAPSKLLQAPHLHCALSSSLRAKRLHGHVVWKFLLLLLFLLRVLAPGI
jgi:hypothetical protein